MRGKRAVCLSTESVQGSSLAFQGVDNIESCDSLSLGMLGVGDSITDKVLKEDLVESPFPRAFPPLPLPVMVVNLDNDDTR